MSQGYFGNRPFKVIEGCLLFLLRGRRRTTGIYYSGADIRTALISGSWPDGLVFEESLSIESVKKSLSKLQKMGLLEMRPVPKPPGSKPGPDPNGFRFTKDAHIVKWRSTALLLLSLYDDDSEQIAESAFLARLSEGAIIQDDTGLPAGREEIAKHLEYCIGQGYVTRTASGGEIHLSVTGRVDVEKTFLDLLVREPVRVPAGLVERNGAEGLSSELG